MVGDNAPGGLDFDVQASARFTLYLGIKNRRGDSTKITVAYLPEDEKAAAAALAALRRLHPDGKVRKSDRHPPYLHIYLTTKQQKQENGT